MVHGTTSLRFADQVSERAAARTVSGVWTTLDGDRTWGSLAAATGLRDLLVAVRAEGGWCADPHRADVLLRRLVSLRAAALAVATRQGSRISPVLSRQAARYGIPLLTATAGMSWQRLAQDVSDQRHREDLHRADRLGELLDVLRHGPRPDTVQRLTDWLADATGATVALVGPAGTPITTVPAGSWPQLAGAFEMIAEIRAGGSPAVPDPGGVPLALHAIGPRAPHHVLAVMGVQPFAREARESIAQAAGLFALALQSQQAEAGRTHARATQNALKLAVFQLLTVGETDGARRCAEAISPGLLDAPNATVHLLEVPPGERDQAERECAGRLHGKALALRCPASADRLIVVEPSHDRNSAHEADTLARVLRQISADGPGRLLRRGTTVPVAETARSHREASRALAIARLRRDQSADIGPSSQLATVLDGRAAHWARNLLQPLLQLPPETRDPLTSTLRIFVRFPGAQAANVLGLHRHTVTTRTAAATTLLGLDLGNAHTRALLDLALQLQSRIPPSTAARAAPTLAELLGQPAARAWAREFLARLGHDNADLRTTVQTWLACHGNVGHSAERLGVHSQTVRSRLRRAEQVLRRRLVGGASSVCDPLFAFAALGELELELADWTRPEDPAH
ncbi:helix-turn-helix domain-containing protein [Kitasatospora sp. NPDC059571]|uniref:helix-turn-helix domain-containing protein n=1 Tax=Kitasatospora sp. NPDC059571 TaxID=3346871 RepID=UPI0036B42986